MGLPPPHAMPQVCDSAPSPSPSSSGLGGFLPAPSPPGGGSPARSQGGSSTAARARTPQRGASKEDGHPPVPLCPPPRGPRHPLCSQLVGPKQTSAGRGWEKLPGLTVRPGTAQRGHCSAATQLGGRKPPPGRPWDSAPTPVGPSWGARSSWDPGRGLQRAPTPTGSEGRPQGAACGRGALGDAAGARSPQRDRGHPMGAAWGPRPFPGGLCPPGGGPGDGSELRAKVGREGNQNSFTC